MLRGAFRNSVKSLRTDQNCHSKCSIFHISASDRSSLRVKVGTPSQQSEKNFQVFKFFVQENVENKYCQLKHNKLCYTRILTFCAGIVKLQHLQFVLFTFLIDFVFKIFSFIVFKVYQGQLLQNVFRTDPYAHKKNYFRSGSGLFYVSIGCSSWRLIFNNNLH